MSARACVCMCRHVQSLLSCQAELALPSAGLLSQSLEFSSPADNYTVCEGDNATLRYLPSQGLRNHPVLLLHLPWGTAWPCQSGEVVKGMDSGPGSMPGPQSPHLSSGWRKDNHYIGCHRDLTFCTHTLPVQRAQHTDCLEDGARLISPDQCCSPHWVSHALWPCPHLSGSLSFSLDLCPLSLGLCPPSVWVSVTLSLGLYPSSFWVSVHPSLDLSSPPLWISVPPLWISVLLLSGSLYPLSGSLSPFSRSWFPLLCGSLSPCLWISVPLSLDLCPASLWISVPRSLDLCPLSL